MLEGHTTRNRTASMWVALPIFAWHTIELPDRQAQHTGPSRRTGKRWCVWILMPKTRLQTQSRAYPAVVAPRRGRSPPRPPVVQPCGCFKTVPGSLHACASRRSMPEAYCTRDGMKLCVAACGLELSYQWLARPMAYERHLGPWQHRGAESTSSETAVKAVLQCGEPLDAETGPHQ